MFMELLSPYPRMFLFHSLQVSIHYLALKKHPGPVNSKQVEHFDPFTVGCGSQKMHGSLHDFYACPYSCHAMFNAAINDCLKREN